MPLPQPFRFEQVIYPLWRRSMPRWIEPLASQVFRQRYPAYLDDGALQDAWQAARFLLDWHIWPGSEAESQLNSTRPGTSQYLSSQSPADLQALADAIDSSQPDISTAPLQAAPGLYHGGGLRIPAQWEAQQRVIVRFGTLYPWIWPMHARMIEAISQVAECEVLVESLIWAQVIHTYLVTRDRTRLAQLKFTVLPTDDIWVRDYGPIVCQSPAGAPVAVDATYAVLPHYPQADDNAMPRRWAAHHHMPVRPLDLFTEGGNLWSDGQGTLIMSAQIFYSNPYFTRETLEDYLHEVFDYHTLIVTPRLTLEETGHVDLLTKLADSETILLSAAESFTTQGALRETRRILQQARNAAGQHYNIVELPTPGLLLNWGTYTIRRAYTNALTVNGTVLVPTYAIAADDVALRTYQQHMPGVSVVPIDASRGAYGGGAVHCMTKEVPVTL